MSRSYLVHGGSRHPLVIAVLAVAVLSIGGLLGVTGNVRAMCPSGPSGCPPPPPPSCPTPYSSSISILQQTVNPTNFTIEWSVSPEISGTSSFGWGYNTSYSWQALSNAPDNSALTVFEDYLDPGLTYYYHITASGSCTDSKGTHSYPGSYSGSFTPGSDSMTSFSGIVYNAAGTTTAPASEYVIAWCDNPTLDYDWVAGSQTNSAGYYSISAWDGCNPAQGGNGYHIGVFLDQGVLYGEYGTHTWNGQWNETIVTWSVQTVNFYLPQVFVGPYVPQLLMFTNSTYATLSYNETVAISTSYSAEVAGNGGTQVSKFTAQESGSSTGQSLENWVQYYTSGTVEFNGMTRQPSILNTSFYGAIQNATTQDKESDPVSASSVSAAQCYDNGMWYNYNITQGQIRGGGVTISGSVTFTSGLNIEVNVGLEVGGGVSVGVSIPIQFTFATTQSFSNAFYFSIDNTASVGHVFRAYVQGGSNTETGVIVHVWQLS